MLVIIQYFWSAASGGRGVKSQANVQQPLANTNGGVEATQFKLTFPTNKGKSTLFNNWKIPVAWTYIITGSENTSSSLQCLLWVSWLELAELFIGNSSYCECGSFLHSEVKRCCGSVRRGCDMTLGWVIFSAQIHSVGMRKSKCPFVESQLYLLKIQFSP